MDGASVKKTEDPMSILSKMQIRSIVVITILVCLFSYAQSTVKKTRTGAQVSGTYDKLVLQLKGSPCLSYIQKAVEKSRPMFADIKIMLKAASSRKNIRSKPYLLATKPLASVYEDNKELIMDLQRLMIQYGAFMIDYSPEDAVWDKKTPNTVYHLDPVGAFVLLRMSDQLYLLDRNFPEMNPAGPNTSDSEHYFVQYESIVIRDQKLGQILVSARLPSGSYREYAVILRVAFLTDKKAISGKMETEQARDIAKGVYPEMHTLLPIRYHRKP